jgi:glycosyltransferase involved in cell wall biosynthesis
MRALLQGRSAKSLAATPGGDQVQIEETASALRELGVEVEISGELEPDLTEFDLVHLFGLVRPQEVWTQARNATRQRKPVFLSTVYCDVWEFEVTARGGLLGLVARGTNRNVVEATKAVGRALFKREWSQGTAALLTRGYEQMQRDIVASAEFFLPNSWSEWQRVTRDLELDAAKHNVVSVPNATSPPPPVDPVLADRFAGYRDCVLCVARIEGRKNQLQLIRAIADTEHTLVLTGSTAGNQRRYIRQVLDAANNAPNVHVLGPVSESEKWALYALARVHVLPSWMETTGLSSLEAAASGCAIVVSPNGDTREYFGDDAQYCDPSDALSIRTAVDEAVAAGPSPGLEARCRTQFTWRIAAEKTLEAYRQRLFSDEQSRR